MLFPRTIFADKNSALDQLEHLQSEINEVRDALIAGDYTHAAEEAVDVQHSADTLLRILMERHGADSHGAYTVVNIKNVKRGYYDRP